MHPDVDGDGDSATVLLVEDNARIRQALAMALHDEGYRIEEAPTGEAGLDVLRSPRASVAAIVLDLMLPGMDGFEVCRQIRLMSDVPIIMLTARTDAADVIAGLEAGADDYVTKPVDAAVLAARIRAVLRRARGDTADTVLTVGDVTLHPLRGTAERAGADLHLTKTEFRLLCELIAAGGRVVSREELLARVWDYDYFGDTRLLDVHIRRVRRKIEIDPSRPRHVLTVRGRGYKVDA